MNSYRTERLEKIIARASSLLDMNQHGSSFSPFPATEALDLAWAVCELSKRHDGPNETRWQPIVTAPKDGNIILSDGIKVSEGGWMTDVEQGAEYEGQAGMAGWWSLDSIDKPTHWMPLPSIPATGSEGSK